MTRIGLSGLIQFTEEALADIAAAIPAESPPEQVALLPELLRAWAAEELSEHLSREGRALVAERSGRLIAASKKARGLLEALGALDEHARFLLAIEPQIRRELRTSTPQWARFRIPDDLTAGERWRDETLSWLRDFADAFAEFSQSRCPTSARSAI